MVDTSDLGSDANRCESSSLSGGTNQKFNIFIIMEKIIKLTESDLTRIVESVLNERRLSASELIKDMTLRDVVDVVNKFTNKTISIKEVKEEIEYKFRNR